MTTSSGPPAATASQASEASQSSQARLWEIEHPQSCATANFFNTGQHFEYESWQEFYRVCGDTSVGGNLVFRWDWKPNDWSVQGQAALREYADRFGDRDHAWTLQLFRMIQSKGIFQCTEIQVCKADEPEVRAWLAVRAGHMRTLWEPLLDQSDRSGDLDPGDKQEETFRETVLATVDIIDVAADARRLFGPEGADLIIGHKTPEHDYRLHLTLPTAVATMHRGATAEDAIEYLERDRRDRQTEGV